LHETSIKRVLIFPHLLWTVKKTPPKLLK